MTPDQALVELNASTRRFLTRNRLTIEDRNQFSSGSRSCSIADFNDDALYPAATRAGRVLGRLRSHDAKGSFGIVAAPGGGSATALFGESATYTNFRAKWLEMSGWHSADSITKLGRLRLTRGDQEDLLFTIALTGCAVVVDSAPNGDLLVLHVRPSGGTLDTVGLLGDTRFTEMDGRQTQTTLAKAGWNAVYGAKDYGRQRKAIVVGAKRADGWRLYAQEQDEDGNILKVKRIWPKE